MPGGGGGMPGGPGMPPAGAIRCCGLNGSCSEYTLFAASLRVDTRTSAALTGPAGPQAPAHAGCHRCMRGRAARAERRLPGHPHAPRGSAPRGSAPRGACARALTVSARPGTACASHASTQGPMQGPMQGGVERGSAIGYRARVSAPVREEAVRAVDLQVGDLECNDLVRVGRKQQVLVALVPGLLLLLVCGHEAVPRLGALLDLGVLHLWHQACGGVSPAEPGRDGGGAAPAVRCRPVPPSAADSDGLLVCLYVCLSGELPRPPQASHMHGARLEAHWRAGCPRGCPAASLRGHSAGSLQRDAARPSPAPAIAASNVPCALKQAAARSQAEA